MKVDEEEEEEEDEEVFEQVPMGKEEKEKEKGTWSQETDDSRICYGQSSQSSPSQLSCQPSEASSSQSSPSQVSSQPSISASQHRPKPLKPGGRRNLERIYL